MLNKVIWSFIGIVFFDFLYVDSFVPYMFLKNERTPMIACLTFPLFVIANQFIFDYIKRTWKDYKRFKHI